MRTVRKCRSRTVNAFVVMIAPSSPAKSKFWNAIPFMMKTIGESNSPYKFDIVLSYELSEDYKVEVYKSKVILF